MGGRSDATFDAVRYERDVVRPLRARPKHLPADLRVRYAIDEALSDAQLHQHLDVVVAHWSERSQEKTWTGAVYQALMLAHRGLVTSPGVDLVSRAWWLSYRPPEEETGAAPEAVPPRMPLPVLEEPTTRVITAPSEPDEQPPEGRAPPRETTASAPREDRSDGGSGATRRLDSAGGSDVTGGFDPATAPVPGLHKVRRLQARRTAGNVVLTWAWPEGSTQAEIVWDGNRRRITRQQYWAEAGFHAMVGAESTEFAVSALWLDPRGPRAEGPRAEGPRAEESKTEGSRAGGYRRSEPVRVMVPAQLQEVRYHVRPVRRGLRSSQYTVEFRTDQPPVHCEIDIVMSRSPILPFSVEDCEPIEIAYLRYEQTSVSFTIPRRSGTTWLRCFVRGDPPIVLIDPPVTELRI